INKWRGDTMSREVRLSRRDETLVDLLIETGLSRNIAKTLVFLSKRDETTSVEIEKATGLRQPEVSIAMQELRRRKWVDKRDIKKEGKGRPVHSYRLNAPCRRSSPRSTARISRRSIGSRRIARSSSRLPRHQRPDAFRGADQDRVRHPQE